MIMFYNFPYIIVAWHLHGAEVDLKWVWNIRADVIVYVMEDIKEFGGLVIFMSCLEHKVFLPNRMVSM